jgi:hypothetical protein
VDIPQDLIDEGGTALDDFISSGAGEVGSADDRLFLLQE